MSSRPPHVLIVGAGTGGLCLAHGLRRAGISVAVYERYRTRGEGLLGYRVGIGPTGSRALRECLPPALFDVYLATCARSPRYFNVITQGMRRTASFTLRPDTDPVDTERSVARMTLRQVLLTGMEDVVHFDKAFTRYDQRDDGTVTAHFADGSTATGDLLVAADGTHSAVRRQYLPHAVTRDAGTTNIATRIPLTPHTRGLLPERIEQGISLIFGTGGMMGVLHVMEFKWDRDGALKPGVDPADAELLRGWPGLRHDNTRDNINLVVWSTARRFPPDVMQLRGEDLVLLALRLTRNWHPNLRELLARSDPGSALPIKVATSEPVPPWKSSTVTLLGDAIHTMTPGRGVGANTALRDAALLCRQLRLAATGDKTLLQAVADYEAAMVPYGFARVADSLNRSGTSGDDRMYKPVVGRLALLGARGYFGVTSRVPRLARRFVDDFYSYRGEED
ncbi:2-polyprenyl-6-methoxyphenol hydroxylase-like FAD-dependent oxidoreductase [Micromonospora sp. M71_S20]|uniref:FAD-dependent oxidoreductase n=1 Tax=Micromonospora sp. M71_S20 TaxID=592872 RepID=UPI000EB1AF29|nr:NAD(P)/FAD-dependent oxidoreductase [Micromonospora sp. M71_S20]RLK26088.1 2-polyprenyl-6-methoxyphenol hydroxylase-like FAD-dependent oxidoreductase [Micromonospora sp. M71_S20]